MISIKFWYIDNSRKVIREESFSRVPIKGEKIKFNDVEWTLTVSEVTHTQITDTETTVATCFLTW